MATWLKQSTAVEIKLGPFLDETDGKTAETALTIEDEHVDLAKNGGDWGDKTETTTCVHESQGWYRCLLDTTDTNTLGILIVKVHVSGALPVWREFMVAPANVYDSLFSTDKLQVHVDEMTAGIITATVIADGAIDAGALAADTITAAKVASDVGTEIGTAVWATTTRVLTASTNLGDLDDATLSAIAALEAKVDTIDDFLDTEIAAIKAKTDNLPSDPADASVIAGRFDTLDTSVADLPTNAELATALGTADDAVLAAIAALNNLSQANIRTAIGLASANLDTQLDALPTNSELSTALGTADDAVLAAIAALNNVSVSQILTTQMTEAYAANGTAPTLAQALLGIHQAIMHFGISGTSKTVKKLNNSDTAFVITHDSATTPTSAART